MYDLTKESWTVQLPGDSKEYPMKLPGTLDTNQIGYPDSVKGPVHPDEKAASAASDEIITTRFTRKYTYEGPAFLKANISFIPGEGKRYFLEAERARCLTLSVNGKTVPDFIPPSISTPHIFEVTGLLTGNDEILFTMDNSYPGCHRDSIVYSSAAADETQTNWNGILGCLQIREELPVFLSALRVYPMSDHTLTIQAVIEADRDFEETLTLTGSALSDSVSIPVSGHAGSTPVRLLNLSIKADAKKWDEYEGNLQEMTGRLSNGCEKTVRFGIRVFGDDGKGHLALNGRRIFLRSEANCAEFPETGYIPTEKETWLEILAKFKAYGVNCMRFHSHCPPEGAFEAADEMGMLMQPELSHWNPKDAFEVPGSFEYYSQELEQIIPALANHPSFVMLTFGNELQCGKTGHERMNILLAKAKDLDSTRLYANASNPHYGNLGTDPESDFYAAQSWHDLRIRATLAGNPETKEEEEAVREYETQTKKMAKVNIKGYLNNQYPNAKTSYDETLKQLRTEYKKPVFSFEVGQFEILPDFDELEEFKGISDPANYRTIQEKMKRRGLEDVWKDYVSATGEISRLCYREEIEAAMRTEDLSGISLLGIQDFPGQGTALVGMMNSHLQPKPFDFARPEEFQKFFRDSLLLVGLEKYTYENSEILKADISAANYGKNPVNGPVEYSFSSDDFCRTGTLGNADCPAGSLKKIGRLEICLKGIAKPTRLNLNVKLGSLQNSYPVWVYPAGEAKKPEGVYETSLLDEKAEEILKQGGRVYYSPASTKENFPASIRGQFSTDFWSVGTFGRQEGGMGQYIDASHPIFSAFPTEKQTNWQWWPMAGQRAVILPKRMKTIITEMDSYAFLRDMAQLFECRIGKGKLLYSTLGLQNLQQYPEARALQKAIYSYLSGPQFEPEQTMSWEELIRIGQSESFS